MNLADTISLVANVSSEIVALGVLLVALVLVGVYKSKDMLLTILCALYPAVLITEYFPFYSHVPVLLESVGADAMFYGTLLVFILTLGICVFILKGYIHSHYQHNTFWRILELVVLSVTIVGFLAASLYHVVHIEAMLVLSPLYEVLFTSTTALFSWMIAPLLSIPIFVRK